MAEENTNKNEEQNEVVEPANDAAENDAPASGGFFTRRRVGFSLGFLALLLLLVGVTSVVLYRTGYFDNQIKAQFVAKMADIGIVFDADEFHLRVAPLRLELRNATFNDKTSGDKLFFIKRADLNLSVTNLYAWQLSRDISVETTDVDGFEAYVKFDENGKSNFSNLNLVQDQAGSRVNFKYSSAKFSLKNGTVHYGDAQHKLGADANNILFFLEPLDATVPDEQKRFKFDLTSTDSKFTYDESAVDDIDVRAKGIADNFGAEMSEFKLTSPIGETSLSGKLTDWERLIYDFNVESTVDLTQTSSIFPLGTAIRGVGNFAGHVTGEGENYKIEGNIESDALAADNIRLKGLNIAGTVAGENSMYEANGKAIAEMLTFEDFQIDALQLIGNIRGTGSDFKWFGELQAAAAKSPLGTIAGLYVSDAVGEYKDRQLNANLGSVRAGNFNSPDAAIQGLNVRNVKIFSNEYRTDVSAPNLNAGVVKAGGATITGANTGNLKLSKRGDATDITAGNFRANSVKTADATVNGVNASGLNIKNRGDQTDLTAGNLRANSVKTADATINGVNAGNINVRNRGNQTNVTAENLRADSVAAAGANIKGVAANNLELQNRGNRTDVKAGNLTAQSVQTKDARLRNLNARNLNVQNQNGTTSIQAGTVQADGVTASGANIGALTASGVNIKDSGNTTEVYSDNLKVAKLETDAAVLGSVSVAGVRLTIRQGRIEARSGDIDAGNVALTKSALPDGGNLQNVKIYKPVFILEPSGAYRASADMSLGGGVLGSVKLGAARASIVAQNSQIAVNNLTADVMDGRINGDATIALNNRGQSRINAAFADLDLSKLLALQGGRVIPIEGKTTGNANLTFTGTNFKTASGNLTADFAANAGTSERGLVPLNGRLGLTATNGLFNVDFANLNTEKSAVNATGRFDLGGNNSNLNIALNSSDASEIERIIRVLNLSPELEAQLDSNQIAFGGNFNFNANVTGNLSDPTIDGRAAIDSLIVRGRDLGSLATNLSVSPSGIELRDGVLQERNGGGNLAFNITIPSGGTDNISLDAKLNNINTGNLLAALPGGVLPAQLNDFQAQTSGTINVTGIPGNLLGEANISSGRGTINGEAFDGFDLKATFAETLVNLEKFETRFGDGFLRANGTYRTDSTVFDLNVEGKNIQVARVLPFIPNGASFSNVNGTVDLTAKATGEATNFPTYNINFNGVGRGVTVNENGIGDITFAGVTANQVLNANVTANFNGKPQAIVASVNFADENLPFRAETTFNQTELAPLIALGGAPEGVEITGQATGRVFVEGNLYGVGADGKRGFNTDNLSGAAAFNQFALNIGETQFLASEPVAVRFNSKEVVVENAKFAGSGTNVVVSGTKALTPDGINNLTVDGRVNLSVLNALSKNTFVAGFANVAVRLTGDNTTARLNGTADLQNIGVSTFIGSERLSLDRIKGRILFTSNQAQIDNLTGFLGGGRINVDGGATLKGLELQGFRFNVTGNNFTAPVPPDFVTTGDAEIAFSGRRNEIGVMNSLISGRITAKRTIYTQDIDLGDIVSGRREGSLSAGSSGSSSGSSSASFIGVPNIDISIEGRDALVVRNNLADLTASAVLRVTGDTEYPIISGRVTADRGTIFFRKDRYEIQRAVVEFPPNTAIDPFINLQAETEISGYTIIVNLVGELNNTETLNATVRSSPALPQGDVISLITTGNLANTDTGIPTLAQTGINTAAEILTDELINNPLSKATDKLFGLNRFEIDPLVSGQRLNPSARLTVGRQINRNLLVTYSTNLSADQNQILALEYRVSNRVSLVAQYEQRSLSNVTRNNNNFSFEVRFRKRF